MLNRRDFLKLNGLLAFLSFTVKAQTVDENKPYTLPKNQLRVWQGATDNHSTLITVLASKEAYLFFQVHSDSKSIQSLHAEKIDLNYGEYILYQISISQLEIGSEYTLSIYDKVSHQTYNKKFAALDLSNTRAKIALLSCANYKKAESQEAMCQQLYSVQPDVIFFLGDLVYANSAWNTLLGSAATPEEAYLAYTRTILEIDLYNSDKLVPIFAIHDDHDLGKNNSDISNTNKDIMLKMFRNFFPVDDRVMEVLSGPGNAFAMPCFGMLAVFFDTRSFKDQKKNHYLGAKQIEWLKELLIKNRLPVMLISTQQFWNYRSLAESYQSTSKAEFQDLMLFLSDLKQNLFFVSGDVHYSQLQKIDYEKVQRQTYEITSSAFFSSSARNFGKRSIEEGQLFYYGYPNFIILEDLRSEKGAFKMKLCCYAPTGGSLYSEEIEVYK